MGERVTDRRLGQENRTGFTSTKDYDSALSELEQVYQDLEEALKAFRPHCAASGFCCNFKKGQYILFASELELERVRRRVNEKGPWKLTDEGECPHLLNKKCNIHKDRPLGCRTYFCDPTYKPHETEVYQKFCDRITEISIRYNIPRNYRPFHGKSGLQIVSMKKVEPGYKKNPQDSSGTKAASHFPIL